MKMLVNLASLALRCTTGMSDSTVNLLTDRFSDASQRMTEALQNASARAWRTLEISLAGTSFLDRAKGVIASREEQVLRDQIQGFLDSHVVAELNRQSASFRQSCFKELQRARKAKLIPGTDLHIGEAASEAHAFTRYTDARQVVAAELQSVAAVAEELTRAGYRDLGKFVSLCPAPGPYPLLVIAVRYFFRRAVEEDPRLSNTWQFQQLEGLSQAQQAGFEQLDSALRQHGAKMEQLLEDVLEVVTETRDDVKAIREEMQQLRELLAAQRSTAPVAGPTPQQLMELYQSVLQTMQAGQAAAAPSQPLPAAVAPLAVPIEIASGPAPRESWAQVQSLLSQCQALPKQQQRQLPALFRAVGKLKAAAGNDQTRSRLFPLLASTSTKESVADGDTTLSLPSAEPIVLPEAPGANRETAKAAQAPRLLRVQGRPISPLFQAAPSPTKAVEPLSADTPPQPPPSAPKPAKRLVSKLFDPPKKD